VRGDAPDASVGTFVVNDLRAVDGISR